MTATATEASGKLLGRVRKLLAKAEDESVTEAEALALTEKAAELMAKYGIDAALLGATQPETDKPGNTIIELDNPWARVKAHLLCGLGSALRCRCIMLTGKGVARVHVFGYNSDLERLSVLYTSVLLQMSHQLVRLPVPEWSRSPKAYRRSWLLGYCTAVISRVRAAEAAATAASTAAGENAGGVGTALVLQDRQQVIAGHARAEYPITRTARVTYSGSGYGAGYAQGQKANIGGTGVGRGNAGALAR